jgi:GMP synthase (glutamine-hydrolysing)
MPPQHNSRSIGKILTTTQTLNMLDKILVVDFGSQYNQLIVRRIREQHVYSELVQSSDVLSKIDGNVKGIIFSGGPNSVYDKNSFRIPKQIYDFNIPILGICYGMQLIAQDLNGCVKAARTKEYGHAIVNIKYGQITDGLSNKEQVWMSHGDYVSNLPNGFVSLGSSSTCKISIFENRKLRIYGLQFHPEVSHTANGNKIIRNFIFKICKAKSN